ncbi:hypothetical protein SAMN03080603_00332 [Acetomicrobium thermoterrenum DSM 13490]|jgi:hypothetical protein|uniref:Uncharacterized protein n=1 Tax=Acetomicrobium thermoterrenum DSM 13490 TaxID=1120987 RepID=A0A1H3E1V6_9BACT|nr:hypothetical protein [Acetomicrobium thermoterrenum]SDX71909.1 hypothetical protein SAMN03080603_00332 [Acetomicrobium thermoterrenum DSM 13490]
MNMKKAVTIILTIALALGVYGVAHAADTDTATQSVHFEVAAINEISVSDDPQTLIISEATPGSDPTPVTDSSTTYAITTNGTNKKITAAIGPAMPTGLTLKVELEAPTGATPQPDVVLDTSASDVVTGISQVAASNLTITYTLEATAEAEVGSGSTTVTFTLTDA